MIFNMTGSKAVEEIQFGMEIWRGFSQNLLQFRSSFSLDRICLLRQPVGDGRVRRKSQKCEMAGAEVERLMERRRRA